MCIQSSRLDLLTHCCDHSFASGHCATPIVALPSTFLHRQIRSRQDVKYYGFDGRSIDFVNFMYANKVLVKKQTIIHPAQAKRKVELRIFAATSQRICKALTFNISFCISCDVYFRPYFLCLRWQLLATSFVVKADAHIDVAFLWKVDFLCLVKPFSLSVAFFQPENPVSTNESSPFSVDGSSIAVVRAQVWHNTVSLSSI